MSEYIFKTRDGKVDENKPTVLISMHPGDRFERLDALISQLLDAFDCRVCYSLFPDDNTPCQLQNVSLGVIGVTEKYITWKNSGFVSEFTHLINQSVPVLPIMYETGINNLFNTRCGKLQYVDYTTDETKKLYAQKLNCHVVRVLTHQEVEGDKNNDGKKIFISYRKKDKVQLTKLVEMIEKSSGDKISLWYDTNLNPGDDYKDTIIDKIKECDAYILLITPRVLEADNYVMRVEYPLARKLGKEIIPIEMEKTNKTQLSDCYPHLPKCLSDKHISALISKFNK